MVKAKINSGACGFETSVQAEAGPDYLAGVKITSGCQHINKMAEKTGHPERHERTIQKRGITGFSRG